jgi:hypothetical protein
MSARPPSSELRAKIEDDRRFFLGAMAQIKPVTRSS